VFVAEEPSLARRVVIKVLAPELARLNERRPVSTLTPGVATPDAALRR
jgi:hypothetical protein